MLLTMCLPRWRICFWISIFPASMLALLMVFCAESPHWLYKVHFLFKFLITVLVFRVVEYICRCIVKWVSLMYSVLCL